MGVGAKDGKFESGDLEELGLAGNDENVGPSTLSGTNGASVVEVVTGLELSTRIGRVGAKDNLVVSVTGRGVKTC